MQLVLPECGRPQYPQKRINKHAARVIGWLLHNANSSPPVIRRTEFYAMKTRILQMFATPGAAEYQHFEQKDCRHCWRRYDCDECDSWGKCCRCDGTGIYLPEVWITLIPWTLGGFCFHSIGPKLCALPDGDAAIIEGKIIHESKPYLLPDECRLWLELLFEPRHFFKYFGCSMHFWKLSFKRPLVSLGTIIGAFRFDRWRIAKALLPHRLYFWLKYRQEVREGDEIPF